MLELDNRGVPASAIYNGERREFGYAGVHFLTEQEIIDLGFDNDEKPVSGLTPGECERLAELGKLTDGVQVFRDWENCLTAMASDRFTESTGLDCALTIGHTGTIGHYSVNVPRVFPNLAMLLAAAKQGQA